MKRVKKVLVSLLSLAMVLTSVPTVGTVSAYAAGVTEVKFGATTIRTGVTGDITPTAAYPTGNEAFNKSGDITVNAAAGYDEGLYAKFSEVSRVDGYIAYTSPAGANSWKRVDNELIRKYPDFWRVDALGLKAGSYDLKICAVMSSAPEVSVKESIISGLTVTAKDRSGFAFTGSTTPGAYKADGTLKDNALVIYATNANFNTVTYAAGKQTLVGVQNIIGEKGSKYVGRPICVRVLGTIDTTGFPSGSWGSSGEGLAIKYADHVTPLNITVEGVGDDATFKGFGVFCRSTNSVEIANLGLIGFVDDGVSLDTDNYYTWVHNMDIMYGATGGDSDQAKGDGSLDVKGNSKYQTYSYNHFWDSGKMSLCGMKSESGPNYITYHHNWFDHSDSRHPRIRTMSVHVYNNYYDGNAKYGVGVTTGSDAFVESNYFRNCQYPFLSSLVGNDVYAGSKVKNVADNGTFSSETPGSVKAYNNVIEGKFASYAPYAASQTGAKMLVKDEIVAPLFNTTTDFDAYEVSSRTETVPASVQANGQTYSNFDTTVSLGVDPSAIDDVRDIPSIVTAKAGRLSGGDFLYKGNSYIPREADSLTVKHDGKPKDYATKQLAADGDTGVNLPLKSAELAYTTTLVSVGGLNGASIVEKFNVTIDPNNGESTTTDEYVKGTKISSAPATPTAPEGKAFGGWYSGTEKVTFPYTVNDNATIKAKWLSNFTVSFDSDGGSDVASQTVLEGNKATKPTDPTNGENIFKGWYVGENVYDFNTAVTGDVTLRAEWLNAEDVRIITYTGVGSDNYGIYKVASGEKAENLEGKIAGYTFDGWFEDEELTTPFDFDTVITVDTTIYGKWTALPAGDALKTLYWSGKNTSAGDTDYFEVSGSTKDYSKKAVTYDGQTYSYMFSFDSSASIKFTTLSDDAQFTTMGNNGLKVKLTNDSEETFTTGVLNPGEPSTITLGKAGVYTVVRDTKEEHVAFISVLDAPPVPADKNVTLHLNDGTIEGDKTEYTVAGTDTKKLNELSGYATPTKEGYVFDGWYKEEEFTNKFEENETITESVELYAKWTELYTVSFEVNGGEDLDDLVVKAGTALNAATGYVEPVYGDEVHRFGGFYTDAALTTPFAADAAVTTDLRLYVKWVGANGGNLSTITFHANGGDFESEILYEEGQKIVLDDPIREESEYNVFAGWYKSDNTTKVDFSYTESNNSAALTGDVHVYARWAKDGGETETKYYVRFVRNYEGAGENVIKSSEGYDAGASYSVTAPETATREGYSFVGWYKDAECTVEAQDSDYTGTIADADIIFYAKWEPYHHVVFDANYKDEDVEVITKTSEGFANGAAFTVTKPADPEREGYRFDAWYKDAECTVKITDADLTGTMGDADITYYAKWNKLYSITYDGNYKENDEDESKIVKVVNYIKGEAYTLLENAIRAGYTFLGWFTNSDTTTPASNGTMGESNLRFFAKWEKKYDPVTTTVNFNATTLPDAEYSSPIVLGDENKITIDAKVGSVVKTDTKNGNRRLKLGTGSADAQNIHFDVMGAGSVTLNAGASNDTDPKTLCLGKVVDGQLVKIDEKAIPASQAFVSYTFELPGAGTYYIYSKEKQINFTGEFKVTYTPTATDYVKATFIVDSKTYSTDMVEKSSALVVPTVSIDAKKVEGWYTSADFAEGTLVDTATAKVSGNTVYYAKLVDDTENWYKVSFVSGEGASEIKALNVDKRATEPYSLESRVPTKEGYTFLGWFTAAEGGEKVEAITPSATGVDTTLYAQWEISTKYKVNFNLGEYGPTGEAAAAYAEQEIVQGKLVTKPADPVSTNEAYEFVGWYKDAEYAAVWDFKNDVVTADTTIYAKWRKIPVFTAITDEAELRFVTAEAPGAEGILSDGGFFKITNGEFAETGKYTFGEGDSKIETENRFKTNKTGKIEFKTEGAATLTICAKSGSSTVANTIKVLKNGTEIHSQVLTVTHNAETNTDSSDNVVITLELDEAGTYAICDDGAKTVSVCYVKVKAAAPVNKYTVSFNLGEYGPTGEAAVAYANQTVAEGKKVTKPADPVSTNEAYEFAGWYKTQELETVWDFENDVVTEDITIYAKWNRIGGLTEEELKEIWKDVTPEDAEGLGLDYYRAEDADKLPTELWVAGVSDVDYTGKAQTFADLHVYYNKTMLDPKKEYSVKYSANTNAGTATITITGKADYSGSLVKTFTINPLDISEVAVPDVVKAWSISTTPQKAKSTVMFNLNGKDIKLVENKDFYYVWPKTDKKITEGDDKYDAGAFVNADDYTVRVIGKGNYTGETSFKETISKLTLMSKVTVTAIPAQKYDGGKAITPEVTVKYSGKPLTKDVDYTVEYVNNTDIGTASVLIKGTETVNEETKLGFIDTKTVTFKINGTNITSVKFAPELTKQNYAWEAAGIRPVNKKSLWVVVKNPETKLNENQYLFGIERHNYEELSDEYKRDFDYIYEYVGDTTNVGSVKINIEGINGYFGKTTKTYKIVGTAITSAKQNPDITKTKDWEPDADGNGKAIEPVGKADGKSYWTEKKVDGQIEKTYLKGISKAEYATLSPEDQDAYDYTYEYVGDTTKVGTVKINIAGVNGFTGKKTVSYSIKGKNISTVNDVLLKESEGVDDEKATVALKVDYKGQAIEPKVTKAAIKATAKTEEVKLTEGKDFTVSYLNNNKNGTATVVLTGINGYFGTKKISFTISQCDLAVNANVVDADKLITVSYDADSAKTPTFAYTKSGVKPVMKLVNNKTGEELVLNKDYTVAYTNNNQVVTVSDAKNAKNPTVTVTGKGKYKGKVVANFNIEKANLSQTTVTAKDAVYANAAGKVFSAVTVTDTNNVKLAATDYDKAVYTYVNATTVYQKVGTAYTPVERAAGDKVDAKDIVGSGTVIRATVKAKADSKFYEAGSENHCDFRVIPQNISNATVKIEKQSFKNAPIIPAESDIKVTVNVAGALGAKNSTVTLKLGEDYEIVEDSLVNNVKKGTAKMTIRGIGEYRGTKQVTFTITAKSLFYLVSYNKNVTDGSVTGTMTLSMLSTNQKVKANTYKRPGYVFKGWSYTEDQEGNGQGVVAIENGKAFKPDDKTSKNFGYGSSQILYAVWEKQ